MRSSGVGDRSRRGQWHDLSDQLPLLQRGALTLTVDRAVCSPPISEKEALGLIEGHAVPVAHSDADLALKPIFESGFLPGLRPMISRVRIVAAEA